MENSYIRSATMHRLKFKPTVPNGKRHTRYSYFQQNLAALIQRYINHPTNSVNVIQYDDSIRPASNSKSSYLQAAERYHSPALGLSPARMREISRPLLNAWLNISRVWNVDINGNHDNMTIGTKMNIPMPAS